MFYGATSANPGVSNWDTSQVENMYRMFSGASSADRCERLGHKASDPYGRCFRWCHRSEPDVTVGTRAK